MLILFEGFCFFPWSLKFREEGMEWKNSADNVDMVNIVKKKMKPNIKMILIVKNIETDLKKSGLNS